MTKEKDMNCINCGNPRKIGRRICDECNKKRLIESAKSRPRYVFNKTCQACNKEYQAWRKQQVLCKECDELRNQFKAENKASNNYVKVKGTAKNLHRVIAEEKLGGKLDNNWVIHHIDDDYLNNSEDNLLIISRGDHGKLHSHLDTQRVIFEKSKNENQGNCWNNLIVPNTTAWLEMTGANVLKVSEIGQSAAELLNRIRRQEEGSETQAPDT